MQVLHLGPQNLHVGASFSSVGRTFFESRAAKPACRPAIFTSRPDRLLFYCFAIFLFYYFISIGLQAGGFCISGRKTCMSARHFHRSASPLTFLLFHYFTISFPLGSRQEVLHLGPQNLHVAPPFYRPFTILLFTIYFTSSLSLGSRQEVFASRAAKPACRLAIFQGRPRAFASRAAKPACRPAIFTSCTILQF